jgi:hypothetical protein
LRGDLHPHRIEGLDRGTFGQHRLEDRDRGRLAQVVGVGLNVNPSRATVLPFSDPPAASRIFAIDVGMRPSFTSITAERSSAEVRLPRDLEDRTRVLRKAGTAVARAGVKELVADALSSPIPLATS